jgi:hypothetical protein
MFLNRSGTKSPLKSLINSVNPSPKLSQLADPLGTICAVNHSWNIHIEGTGILKLQKPLPSKRKNDNRNNNFPSNADNRIT